MKYDDASWHIEEDFPSDLPELNAVTHMGVFFVWAYFNGLVGALHIEQFSDDLQKIKSHDLKGSEYLRKNCDGQLLGDAFNELGNQFAIFYYDDYLDDYGDFVDPDYEYETIFHFPDTWDTYEKVATKLSEKFESWKESL